MCSALGLRMAELHSASQVSMNRLTAFFNAPEVQTPADTAADPDSAVVRSARSSLSALMTLRATTQVVKNGNFYWDDACTKPALTGIDLSIPRGNFTAVVGETGCGKSALLRSALPASCCCITRRLIPNQCVYRRPAHGGRTGFAAWFGGIHSSG